MAVGQALGRLQVDADAVMECRDNLAFMRDLPSESMKLIVTSPPYNLKKAYERKKLSLEEYTQQQAQVISESVRLLHPTGSLCWQVGNHVDDGEIFPLDLVLYRVFKDHGLHLRNRIVWHFEHGLHSSKRLSGRYETILWFTKGDQYTFNLDPIRVPSKYPNKKYYKGPKAGQLSCNPLGKNPGDVWIIPNVKNNHVEKTSHPCQFPVELIERLVLMLTDERDSVLDPYMGVGSAIIAALKNNRRGYGCDIVKEYVEIAWARVHSLRTGSLRMRPIDRPIYDPSKPYGGQRWTTSAVNLERGTFARSCGAVFRVRQHVSGGNKNTESMRRAARKRLDQDNRLQLPLKTELKDDEALQLTLREAKVHIDMAAD